MCLNWLDLNSSLHVQQTPAKMFTCFRRPQWERRWTRESWACRDSKLNHLSVITKVCKEPNKLWVEFFIYFPSVLGLTEGSLAGVTQDATAYQISWTHAASLITQVVFLSHLTLVWKGWTPPSITYQSPERLSAWEITRISLTVTVSTWWEGFICKAMLCDWLEKRKRKHDNVGQRRKEVENAGCLEPMSISVSLHNFRDLAHSR